jgi:hypothetical protein
MNRLALVMLCFLAGPLAAQQAPQPPATAPAAREPTPEETAFARLPPDIRQMLGHMTAAQAMQTVRLGEQHLIALGIPAPSQEQLRTTLSYLLKGPAGPVPSASAGTTSFPPVSPLVPPPGR